MAEFLGQSKHQKLELGDNQGFDAMGKPIPPARKRAADQQLKQMGLTDPDERMACIGSVSSRLEHDDPYGAISEVMRYLDLTGAYRLMAYLLTGPTETEPID